MASQGKKKSSRPEWLTIVKKYQTPSPWRSTWQVLNSLIPFIAIWTIMYFSLAWSYWITLGLAMINAGLFTRLFIIQHDCGHGSFYKNRKANNILGSVLGVLTMTPYFHWRKMHAKHHATAGDLDFRGIGDIDTVTVNEYQSFTPWGRFKYRFFRHPFTLFVIGPVWVFWIAHRLPLKTKKNEKKERASVYWTNLALAGLIIGLGLWIGFDKFALIQVPITVIGTTVGVYLFYVQHQFEDTYWRRHENWDYRQAALKGSTYFRLPKILQWFSGNIGFHHIHHLSPLIPNYMLEKAHRENTLFQEVETLTIASSIRTVFLNLWDENLNRLISFREYYRRYETASAS